MMQSKAKEGLVLRKKTKEKGDEPEAASAKIMSCLEERTLEVEKSRACRTKL